MSRVGQAPEARRLCEAPRCVNPLPKGRRRFCCNSCARRGRAAERTYEPGEFGQATIRMILALANRTGAADTAVLGALWEIMDAADKATVSAIDNLQGKGYSYEVMAKEVGISRQAMHRWRHRKHRLDAATQGVTLPGEVEQAARPSGQDTPPDLGPDPAATQGVTPGELS